MEKTAVDQARLEYGRAAEAVTAMAATTEFSILEKHWAAFLVSGGRIFSKLEQGAKASPKSKAWWGKRLHQRRTDELLRYLWHARNADEHTLQQVTQLQPGSARVVDPTKDDIAVLERAMAKETHPWAPLGLVEWVPQHVLLLSVMDRDVCYAPPQTHLGMPIASTSPVHNAQLALKYFDTMLKEADGLTT